MTLHTQLLNYLATVDGWVSKAALCRMEWIDSKGKLASPENIGRRLRELEEEQKIAVKYENNTAFYRFIPHGWRTRYVPTSVRGLTNNLFLTLEKTGKEFNELKKQRLAEIENQIKAKHQSADQNSAAITRLEQQRKLYL